MMKVIEKVKNKYIILSCAIIVFSFAISLIVLEDNKTVTTSAGVLSTNKIEWGIKRNDNHEQPDLGRVNKQIIDDAKGIAMGNKESKKVYLTFDEGYEAGNTEKILQVLKENNVPATFFITAHYVNTSSELVQKMIDGGHTIGNHTVNHKSMPSLNEEETKKEVMNLHEVIYNKFGYEMKYIRPPKGEYSETSLKYCNNLGYTTVMWSFAYDDWDENKQGREEYAKKKVLDNIHNGAVILLHGNSKDNTNILDYCIKEIKNMGYEFSSLDQFER